MPIPNWSKLNERSNTVLLGITRTVRVLNKHEKKKKQLLMNDWSFKRHDAWVFTNNSHFFFPLRSLHVSGIILLPVEKKLKGWAYTSCCWFVCLFVLWKKHEQKKSACVPFGDCEDKNSSFSGSCPCTVCNVHFHSISWKLLPSIFHYIFLSLAYSAFLLVFKNVSNALPEATDSWEIVYAAEDVIQSCLNGVTCNW